MAIIPIFVATMTGTAEMIAEEIIAQVPSEHELRLHLLQDVALSAISESPAALFVSSTYGEGEVPEPTLPILKQFEEQRPELSHLLYNVIGLGDSATYPDTFAAGGRHWDRVLQLCGAVRHGELLIVDAAQAGDPVEKSVAWASHWLESLPVFDPA